MIPTIHGALHTTPIDEQTGYLKLKVKEVHITNQTNIVVHLINPQEILDTISFIQVNIKHLEIENGDLINNEIETLKTKIKSIMPNPIRRQRRGLVNLVGNAEKWLFGTMDNSDREEIANHLDIIEKNSHNAIQAINEQIKVNKHFNESIESLKTIVRNDRKIILNNFNQIESAIKNISKQQMFLDQITKIRFIDNKVNQIQDNIVSAKHSMIHPSILTSQEINEYEINFYKLRLLRMGVLE